MQKRSHHLKLAPPADVPPPIVDPLPPVVVDVAGEKVTGWRRWLTFILSHFTSWPELYVGLPLAVLGMVALFHFSHMLLGRKPLDEGYDFVGLGFRFLTCFGLILLISFAKQSQLIGTWLTREEQLFLLKTHWTEGVFQKVKMVVFAIIFAVILIH
jgi:hypothetical protein